MLAIYKHWDDDNSTTKTRLLVVSGSSALGIEGRLRMLHAVTDPEPETIAMFVVSQELAVPWTQPLDFALQEDLFSEQMQQVSENEFLFTTFEGAAFSFPTHGQFATLKALATIDGGEPNAMDAMLEEK